MQVEVSERAVTSTLTYVGHATVLLELGGTRILTDPLLRSRVGPLRTVPRLVDPGWSRGIDAVLVSHGHLDHLDRRSLALLEGAPRVIAPGSAARSLRFGSRAVEQVAPGDVLDVAGHTIRVTPAVHGRAGSAVGFLVDSVYFAGDTDVFPEMEEIAPEVALLPVWGWGPTLGPGHMDPTRAVEALRLLRPRVAVPIHWGTLHPPGMRGRRFLTDPPAAFARLARQAAPAVDVVVLPVGGTLELP